MSNILFDLLANIGLIHPNKRDRTPEKARHFFSIRDTLLCMVLLTLAIPVLAQSMSVFPAVSTDGSFKLTYVALPSAGTATVTHSLLEQVGSGSWTSIASLSLGSTSYNLTNKAPGTYSYRISRKVCPQMAPCSTTDPSFGPVTVTVTAPVTIPTTPASISVTPDNPGQRFTVSWSASTGSVARYELERNNTNIYSGTALSRVVSDVTVGVSYVFRVRACNNANQCSAWKTAAASVLSVPAPSVPGSISVVPDHLIPHLQISWTASTGQVARYELQNNNTQIYSGTALSFTFSNASIGQSLTLRVRACNNASLCSAWRTASAVTLQNHFNVPASNTTGSYTISYTAPANGAQLQEQQGSNDWQTIHNGSGTQTASLTRVNGTYRYRLYTCYQSGTCAYLGPVKTTVVSGVAPATPASLTVVPNTTNNSFSISWPAVPGATTYRLQHGSTVLQNTSSRSFTFANATPGTSYSFSVWACAGTVCSASARTASGVVVQVPATLTAVPNTANSTMATSWSAVSGATHYELQQNNVTIYSGAALTRTQTSLTPGTSYTYRLRACNGSTANQCSNWKTIAPVLLPEPVPSTPSSITPQSDHVAQSITVYWSESTGPVVRYELQSNGVGVYSGAARLYTLSNVARGNPLVLRVRACNSSNVCSGWRTASPVTVLEHIDLPASNNTGTYPITYVTPFGGARLQELGAQGDWVTIHSGNGVQTISVTRPNGTYRYRLYHCVQSGTCSPVGSIKTIVVSITGNSSNSGGSSSSAAVPPVGTPVSPPPTDSGSAVPVGATEGQFRVSETGGATYSIPLVVPGGVAGVTPLLAVTYNSQDGAGLLGHGTNLSGLGAITRCRQTLLQDGAITALQRGEGDRFCFGAQRLMLISGSYGAPGSKYKTEQDSYVEVTAVGGTTGNPDSFVIEAKDGSSSTYGGTADAKLEVVAATLTWSLSRFEDSVGNRINYEYEGNRVDGHRIKHIYYAYPTTDSNSNSGAQIDFIYEDRPDKTKGYIGDGQPIHNTQRLQSIRSYNGNTLYRRYSFYYANPEADQLSRLTHIDECMSDASTSCYPSTVLTWGSKSGGFASTPLWSVSPPSTNKLKGYRFLDVDSDGRQDFLWVRSDGNNRHVEYASLSGIAQGGISQQSFSGGAQSLVYSVSDNVELILEVLDYNADGRQDLAVCKPTARYSDVCESWDMYLSVSDNSRRWQLSGQKITLPFNSRHIKFGDINADGLLDAVDISSNTVTIRALARRPNAAIGSNNYYEFLPPVTSTLVGTPPAPSTATGPMEPPTVREMAARYAVLADVNGDGRLDILMPVRIFKPACPQLAITGCDQQTLDLYTYINTGSTYAYAPGYKVSLGANSMAGQPSLLDVFKIVPQDFNGDGFTDLAIKGRVSWHYHLNRGTSFDPSAPLTTITDSLYGVDIDLVDYNRDGYTDAIWHDIQNQQLKLRRWDRQTGKFATSDTLMSSGKAATNAYSFADIDGDGVVDMIEQKYVGNNLNLGIYIGQKGHPAAGMVHKITHGYGREINIKYGTLSDSPNYTTLRGINSAATTDADFCADWPYNIRCTPPVVYTFDAASFYSQINQPFGATFEAENPAPILEMTGPIPIVTEVATSAPTASNPSNVNRVGYYYHHARMQAGGRGYLGFEKLATVDELTGIRTETTYHQQWPMTGSPKATVVTTAEGHKLSESVNTLTVERDTDNPRVYRVNVTGTSESTYGLSNGGVVQGSLLQTTTTANTYDTYGNLTVSEQVVSGGNNTSTQTLTNIFSSDPWEQRMGRLSSATTVTQLDTDPAVTRTTAFEYYGRYDSWPGLLRKETIEPGDNQQVVEYLYDTVGNQRQVSKTADAGNNVSQTRTSQITYDPSGRYVATTVDGLGNITSAVVSRNAHGQPTEIVDVNGVSTYILYASDGREYQRRAASGAWTHTNLSFCSVAVPCVAGARYRVEQLVSGGGKSIEYHDRLGRVIRTSTVLFDGRESHVDIEYDAASRISRQSLPFVDGESLYWTVYEYDLLGRVSRVTEPNGGITIQNYDGYLTTTINALQQTRVEEKNSLGQLLRVTDHLGGTIAYTYDVLGKLTQATTSADGKSVSVRMCYDSLGRKIAMHDPDKGGFLGNATTDCTTVAGGLTQAAASRLAGWWFYRYNDFGELIEQSDTKKQTSTMAYDVLGRMTSRTDRFANLAVDAHTEWTFDRYLGETTTQSRTRRNLTAVVTSYGQISNSCSGNNYCQTYTYDNLARVTDTVTWLPEQDAGYITSVAYDSVGRAHETYDVLNGLVAPSSGTRTLYNAYGYAGEIIDLASGDVLQKTMRVNSRGQVTEEWRNNGGAGIVSYDYHPHSGLLIHQEALSAGLFPIQDVSYEWDVLGNLRSRRNESANLGYTARKDLQESFCYDDLNRLVKSHRGTLTSNCNLSLSQQDMEYDGLGNITRKTGVGTYTYSGKGPHAVTSTSSDGAYTYDNNGNQSGGAGRSITYSSYDQPVAITKGTTTTSFRYGPDRARWQRKDVKNTATTTTHYLGSVERIEVQGSGIVEWKRYVAGAVYTVRTTTSQSGGSTSYAIQRTDKSYLYNDHLGSLDVVVDHVGNITHSASFDAWGQRRHAEDWNGAFSASSLALANYSQPVTQRGFTSHEMLDDVGLIHMNGRIFDPRLARFMQADPYIQAATYSQSYNRYSYTFNNPLNATDPSGYIAWGPMVAWMIGSYAAADYGRRNNIPWLGQVASIVGCVYGYCSAAAFGSSYGTTQNLGVAIIAGISAGAMSGMHPAAQFVMSGMLGGMSSVMMGGEYGHGFVSAGLGSLGGMAGGDGFSIGGMIVSAVVGGTISEMTGGKFKNGAASAAFSYAVTWAAQTYGAGGISADTTGEPDHITDNVRKVFGEDKISVTSTDEETLIAINLNVKKGIGLSGEDFDAIVSDIVSDWNTTTQIDGHTYRVTTALTVDTNILSSGDFVIEAWSSVPSAYRGYAGLNIGKKIFVNRNVTMNNGVPTLMSRSGTSAHEFGHMIGLGHQSNSTNSIMSYAANRSLSNGTDLKRLAQGYRTSL